MKASPNPSLTSRCAVVAASCAGSNLRRAARSLNQFYAKALQASGLEPTQFTLLTACAVAGSAPISALAEALVIDRTTLTRNFQLLAKLGLVEIAEGEDRRVRLVALSGEGRKALKAALPLWQRAQDRIAADLGGKRLDHLMKELSVLGELGRAA